MVICSRSVFGLSFGALLVVACSSSSSAVIPGSGVDAGGGGADNDAGKGGSSDGGASGTTDAGGSADTDAGTGGADAGNGSDASTPLVLTSTLLTSGGAWPAAYACGGAKADVSPPLAWSGGPAAKSYAVVMVDAFFNPAKVHWIIYDMPAATASLAAGIPAGYTVATPTAHQSLGDFAGAQFLSPCPPMGGVAHTYELTVHALDVAALPLLTMTSTATQTHVAVIAHTLASAKMSLTYSR